jgi:hypothetical protein
VVKKLLKKVWVQSSSCLQAIVSEALIIPLTIAPAVKLSPKAKLIKEDLMHNQAGGIESTTFTESKNSTHQVFTLMLQSVSTEYKHDNHKRQTTRLRIETSQDDSG